ncbi:hypothetical protein FJTKL_12785 [Diaporthe vaccinii]|uniref:Uncharacterized protein n=1 Tax=Diaporthe vaccinii TaxID=105482 RepID=A0ABR4ECK0_9PEZI
MRSTAALVLHCRSGSIDQDLYSILKSVTSRYFIAVYNSVQPHSLSGIILYNLPVPDEHTQSAQPLLTSHQNYFQTLTGFRCTRNGPLCHRKSALCFSIQSNSGSTSSMSKLKIIRAITKRISEYARFLPKQFRGPTLKGCRRSRRSADCTPFMLLYFIHVCSSRYHVSGDGDAARSRGDGPEWPNGYRWVEAQGLVQAGE